MDGLSFQSPDYCRRRSRLNLSIPLLLVIGGVKVNPCPSPSTNLPFGMLNIRSVVNKAPLLHSLITDHDLSILAFTDITVRLIDRLRALLNASARLIYASRRTEHVTPLLRDLHWLRYPKRIDYKLAVLVYRCLHGLAPSYLANEFTRVSEIESRRKIRSASTASLVVPRFQRKTLGGRAFPVAAAQAWNSLSSHVTSSSSLASFKRNLKTELFLRSYV